MTETAIFAPNQGQTSILDIWPLLLFMVMTIYQVCTLPEPKDRKKALNLCCLFFAIAFPVSLAITLLPMAWSPQP